MSNLCNVNKGGGGGGCCCCGCGLLWLRHPDLRSLRLLGLAIHRVSVHHPFPLRRHLYRVGRAK